MRIFSIPPTEHFLKILFEKLLNGELIDYFPDKRDPLALAKLQIFLPTSVLAAPHKIY